jgi:hypothetical protein
MKYWFGRMANMDLELNTILRSVSKSLRECWVLFTSSNLSDPRCKLLAK